MEGAGDHDDLSSNQRCLRKKPGKVVYSCDSGAMGDGDRRVTGPQWSPA